MEIWRRFQHLSRGERSIVLEAAAALGATWLGLRVAGFRRWRRLLAQLIPRQTISNGLDRTVLARSVHSIAQLEFTAVRHFPLRTNCLEQSLALWWMLRRRGISAELRIGARKDADRFQAHAWVEWAGEVLDESNAAHLHFAPFDGPVTSLETP